ncbi:hypothetical protein ACFZAM_31535 [Streptomyces sp. NPDC008079]|uniref:hypothetical protein n=1 Tax=Streptomyces sp. NPDC008079 TaxID=3364806 RepID=UPI0036F1020E
MSALPAVLPPDEGPASMVLVRVGGQTVSAKTSENCRTCQSPARAKIDGWILTGFTRPTILGYLADMEPGPLGHPSEKSLRHHTQHHLPLADRSRAAILERRAEQLGDDVDKFGGRVADHLTALDILVSKGFDALTNGEIFVDGPTLLKAIDLKLKVDATLVGGIDANVWRDALMEYMRIAVDFVPTGLRADFARALSKSPILAALSKNDPQ